jgi:hypothetical protein
MLAFLIIVIFECGHCYIVLGLLHIIQNLLLEILDFELTHGLLKLIL